MGRDTRVRVRIDKHALRAILKEQTKNVLREDGEKIVAIAKQLDPDGVYGVEVHEGVNRAYAYVTADNMIREAKRRYLDSAFKAVVT